MVKLKPKYKLWLETEDGYVFGEGSFNLLQGIQEKGTLAASARKLSMSYRQAWGIIKEIEKNLGKTILITHKGGKGGGGGAELTPIGKKLLKTYIEFTDSLNQTTSGIDLE